MTKQNKILLTPVFVATVKKKDNGSSADKYIGGLRKGLYPVVNANGYKQWKQRITIRGKRHDIGLGIYPLISPAEARDAADANFCAIRQGRDIFADRKAHDKREIFTPVSLEDHAWECHANRPQSKEWRNFRHSVGRLSEVEEYASPMIGCDNIEEILPSCIRRVLLQLVNFGKGVLLHSRPMAAQRVRRRMDYIFRYAIEHGFLEDNPMDELDESALL